MNEREIETKVRDALARLGIEYELIEIEPEFADTALFCEKYGFAPEYCGNTIIVASKRGDKKFSACVVRGSRRLDVNKKVRTLMGVSRVSFASAEETIDLTGMMIGGVTAFALPKDLPVYIDETLDEAEYVILGSGSRSSKIKMPSSELVKIPNAEIIQDLSMEPRPAT